MTAFSKHPDFVVHEAEPFNAGPPLGLLAKNFITPIELFFSRNHGAVPAIDPQAYRLIVGGMVSQPLAFSLDDIRTRFKKRTVMATLQCAGNRRDELASAAPIPHELPWGAEAISNAVWGGASVREVLQAAGPEADARHAAFIGADVVERLNTRFGYGSSIPLEKALADEALLAYEMNGEALPALHGGPLRVLVPGYIGARSVKWITEITLQAEPSDNYFQARAYRLFPPEVRPENVVWEEGRMLGELWVNAVICQPQNQQQMAAGPVQVSGYAMGGAHPVERVELSTDGGATWTPAEITQPSQLWTWCLWQGRVTLPEGPQQILARAWDSAGNTQPEDITAIWNFKGYANNVWHRVQVNCARQPILERT